MRVYCDGVSYRLQRRVRFLFIPLWWTDVSECYTSFQALQWALPWVDFREVPLIRDIRIQAVLNLDGTYSLEIGEWRIKGEVFDTADAAFKWANARV